MTKLGFEPKSRDNEPLVLTITLSCLTFLIIFEKFINFANKET